MPRISQFRGIVVVMYFGDHAPPHFHVRYSGAVARCHLDGNVLDGTLPRPVVRLVGAWAREHAAELRRCWERVERHEDPGTIEPLP